MKISNQIYTYIYRWKIKNGKSDDFINSWKNITDYYLEHHNSLGSRLHYIGQNEYIAYANWPNKEARNIAFNSNNDKIKIDEKMMKDAILKSYDIIQSSLISDKLRFN